MRLANTEVRHIIDNIIRQKTLTFACRVPWDILSNIHRLLIIISQIIILTKKLPFRTATIDWGNFCKFWAELIFLSMFFKKQTLEFMKLKNVGEKKLIT